MRSATALISVLLLLALPAFIQAGSNSAAGPNGSIDFDKDGLSDDFEQALLARFEPTFWISADDCDTLPAEFLPASRKPLVAGRNGTVYGQVFQKDSEGTSGAFLEIHYYHLWGRDCGRCLRPR